ncbi:Uncharacterized protein YR821_2146 [Yersinia ruckeri]|uniref:Uncharacterized protein n=1 Tax=Yersinia ruckeri TaxID=29486 RepID=A0A0A8VK09_YERRU|nr:Uncharacterized protein YR821_2146 [Yersinia ruckeri]CEK27951.1 hypothetical protein CSF007_11025 [Yersinia ruckeri]
MALTFFNALIFLDKSIYSEGGESERRSLPVGTDSERIKTI